VGDREQTQISAGDFETFGQDDTREQQSVPILYQCNGRVFATIVPSQHKPWSDSIKQLQLDPAQRHGGSNGSPLLKASHQAEAGRWWKTTNYLTVSSTTTQEQLPALDPDSHIYNNYKQTSLNTSVAPGAEHEQRPW
jgi:hypothetical protein